MNTVGCLGVDLICSLLVVSCRAFSGYKALAFLENQQVSGTSEGFHGNSRTIQRNLQRIKTKLISPARILQAFLELLLRKLFMLVAAF